MRHAFRYRIDFVLLDPEAGGDGDTCLFGRNRRAVASVYDRDHGGPPGQGEGGAWARRVLAAHGLSGDLRLLLLTQPRWLGWVFNPVSFWLAFRGERLIAAIAEVNNTYGDRHSYLCANPDFAPIGPNDALMADKVFHVSPFQPVAGHHAFSFDIRPGTLSIRIAHRNGDETLVATLAGPRRSLTRVGVLRGAARFPFAGLRAIALIHWQALRLRLKGAPFRRRPPPPAENVTT